MIVSCYSGSRFSVHGRSITNIHLTFFLVHTFLIECHERFIFSIFFYSWVSIGTVGYYRMYRSTFSILFSFSIPLQEVDWIICHITPSSIHFMSLVRSLLHFIRSGGGSYSKLLAQWSYFRKAESPIPPCHCH